VGLQYAKFSLRYLLKYQGIIHSSLYKKSCAPSLVCPGEHGDSEFKGGSSKEIEKGSCLKQIRVCR
jgi:hypothetical protein